MTAIVNVRPRRSSRNNESASGRVGGFSVFWLFDVWLGSDPDGSVRRCSVSFSSSAWRMKVAAVRATTATSRATSDATLSTANRLSHWMLRSTIARPYSSS